MRRVSVAFLPVVLSPAFFNIRRIVLALRPPRRPPYIPPGPLMGVNVAPAAGIWVPLRPVTVAPDIYTYTRKCLYADTLAGMLDMPMPPLPPRIRWALRARERSVDFLPDTLRPAFFSMRLSVLALTGTPLGTRIVW